jgi:hypothetical protein
MTKAWQWIQGMWMCFSWIFKMIWTEYMVDLHFNRSLPWTIDDYMWYAERWNGRVAMIAIVVILQMELIYKVSILELIHVL